ncbi:fasciclin domain-containing protein [Modestobacter sp. I12A-02628]|uniref:Fasciclin domain-containing protein n=2 Tax=Goekera deserti TaxID=2497753 RepID=A0A7K3W9A1_9ACTN|nr:fasciclin domain-containing protein [Goekera deserti]NDI49303.1 fasciclin domain-containing protein [Goekera deserti]NEL53041.1 fasciclin domain-containing protein [Goekera deserti]
MTRSAALAGAAALALTLSACGSDDSDTAAESTSAGTSSSSSSAAATTTEAAPAADAPFGPGCASVPTTGAGSFDGMSADPVGTAAGNNPLLSTLVTAVTAADLGDTLNTLSAATVLAPVNDAFAAIPQDALQATLADVPGLTKILTHHVIPERLSPEQLAGTFTTAAGDEVTITGSGENFSIDAAGTLLGTSPATVICGNVQTANATVYIIDQVLKPAA